MQKWEVHAFPNWKKEASKISLLHPKLQQAKLTLRNHALFETWHHLRLFYDPWIAPKIHHHPLNSMTAVYKSFISSKKPPITMNFKLSLFITLALFALLVVADYGAMAVAVAKLHQKGIACKKHCEGNTDSLCVTNCMKPTRTAKLMTTTTWRRWRLLWPCTSLDKHLMHFCIIIKTQ